MKAIELEAERLELHHLESILPVRDRPEEASAEIAIRNLAAGLEAASDSSSCLPELATALREMEDPPRL